MGNLVPDGVFDHAAQFELARRHPFVGPLKDDDAVGHHKGIADTAVGQRAALVQPEQATSPANTRRVE